MYIKDINGINCLPISGVQIRMRLFVLLKELVPRLEGIPINRWFYQENNIIGLKVEVNELSKHGNSK